jgi:hypothetical protein
MLNVCQCKLCTLRASFEASVKQVAVGLFSGFRPSPVSGCAVVAPPYTPIDGACAPCRPVENSPRRFCPICGAALVDTVCPRHGRLRFYLSTNPQEVNA